MLSDDDIRAALLSSGLHNANRTVITRWKDGIDIDFPTPKVIDFARAVERAAYERAAALVIEMREDHVVADAIRALGRRMTDAQSALAQVREVLAAGPTPGPWSVETVPTSCGVCHKVGPFPGRRPGDPPRHACLYADYPSQGNPADDELKANAAFIAACNPAAIAALLAEIDRLTRERDEAVAENTKLHGWYQAAEQRVKAEQRLSFRTERDALAKALAELVACKALKDAGLRSPEDEDAYFRRKLAAWAAARAALAQIGAPKGGAWWRGKHEHGD